MAFGAIAVSDDAEAGAGVEQGPDRFRPGYPLGAVERPARVHDRDVEVLDVGDHPQRSLAVLGLVDLEPICEQPPDPEANERLIVND